MQSLEAITSSLLVWTLLALPATALPEHPHIYRLHNEYRLHLPAKMQNVLYKALPGFSPWREQDYMLLIRRDYVYSWRQAPFAVVGDFNGDKRPDAAIEGHTQREGVLVALLSSGSDWRAIVLERGPRPDPASLDYGWPDEPEAAKGLSVWLTHVPPGRHPGYDPQPLRLSHDAFEQHIFAKAAGIHHWNGKGFSWYVTAD